MAPWYVATVEKLNAKIPDITTCTQCSSKEVEAAEDIVTPRNFVTKEGKVVGYGLDYPQIMVICRNCGHTRYFNLIALDIDFPGRIK